MSEKPIFVDNQTKICSSFLNPVADAVWDALGEPTTPAEARQYIGAIADAPSDSNLYGRKDATWQSLADASVSTGTGLIVKQTSPTLITPDLGTPASGNLANCTGYPLAVTVPSAVSHYGPLVADGTTVNWLDHGMGSRNLLFNSSFLVNQRNVLSPQTLAAGIYGLDRWKGGGSGCTFSYDLVNGLRTLTITAGTLVQVIESLNIPSGTNTCVLSWSGTAQGRIGAGALSASPVTASITGGSNVTIEFGTGTVYKPQFELGAVATPYVRLLRPLEDLTCQRYFQRVGGFVNNDIAILGYAPAAGALLGQSISFPIAMRGTAVVTKPGNWAVANCGQPIVFSSSSLGFTFYVTATAAGAVSAGTTTDPTGGYWLCNAEL